MANDDNEVPMGQQTMGAVTGVMVAAAAVIMSMAPPSLSLTMLVVGRWQPRLNPSLS